MPYFDRFDICSAYLALERDWHKGGWLWERPSCDRRRESTEVQLQRMQFRPAPGTCHSFESLPNDNARDIYVDAMFRFGLGDWLSEDDEAHAPIIRYIKASAAANG